MKTAEEWAKQKVVKSPWTEEELCWLFQQVQADALRFAAGKIRKHGSGSQQWIAVELEEQATALEGELPNAAQCDDTLGRQHYNRYP